MLDKTIHSQLRQLQQSPQWTSFEQAFQEYLKNYFLETSIKRENEFETIWQAGYSEGGKYHLNNFMKFLEDEAQKQ